ncbi:prolyl oligopeptidase family serine peptidase [Andreprevotia chitinilytica]|uniref:prolyl oligopeptidase family serine peptidase n=1 Tax=Andreprevotia chitinilytica TaxID=396808 RepID=UPI0005580CB8|nr:prolyl oligopeptidase family serine peptidase [Andreprevotia chitinilytica]
MPRSDPWPLSPDPFLSLETLNDPAALAWVEQQNANTLAAWCSKPSFETLAQRLAHAYLPHEQPVIPSRWQGWAYDFRQDEHNPKGIWRRMPWASWRSGESVWQNLLDIDALGVAEGVSWVCVGTYILYPDGDRALISLSPGGSDATVVREFDLERQCFVEDGFVISEAGKHTISWIDRNTVYLGWDNGGATLTRSGYPREARRWVRGTALASAPVVFSGEFDDDYAVAVYDPIEQRHAAYRGVDTFDSHAYYADAAGTWHRYDIPTHVTVSAWRGWLLFQPRLDWQCGGVCYSGGALLAMREAEFLTGGRSFVPLFKPTARMSECGWGHTRHYLIVSYLDDVQSRTMLWQPTQSEDGRWDWKSRAFPTREGSQIEVSALEPTLDDEVYVSASDYLLPPGYWLADLARDALDEWELIDRWPTQFDSTPYEVKRGYAQSADGTQVPWTLIAPRSASGDVQVPRPCYLTGYGGFGIPLTPHYLTGLGIGWLARGGVVAFAHIRGGGEFGPKWHQAAQGEHRQRAFDDFIAVAQALIADGVTTAAQLGIQGGSNGGLLVAACMMQRPDLFGAVVSEVPLLDMSRYHLLHAGASWLDEYGDPDDPGDAGILAAYSPYHRVTAAAVYPPVLFTTSTSDDRVHPGHARKMVARMQALGHAHVWYREQTDGGHGGGSDALEHARHDAMVYEFLWSCLSGAAPDTHR